MNNRYGLAVYLGLAIALIICIPIFIVYALISGSLRYSLSKFYDEDTVNRILVYLKGAALFLISLLICLVPIVLAIGGGMFLSDVYSDYHNAGPDEPTLESVDCGLEACEVIVSTDDRTDDFNQISSDERGALSTQQKVNSKNLTSTRLLMVEGDVFELEYEDESYLISHTGDRIVFEQVSDGERVEIVDSESTTNE